MFSSNTINTFKKHVSVELDPETVIGDSSTLSGTVGYNNMAMPEPTHAIDITT